jgi:microsomal dipeptidase-like Zn-dependent dipeptidase
MKEAMRQRKILIGLVIVIITMSANVFGQTWVPKGTIPANAVQGGQENGTPLYVCRGRHEGGGHPGKIVAGNCNISYGGREITLPDYEILVGNGTWGSARPGYAGAFIAGQESGQNLYLCRANFNGTHPGKVIGNNCNIGYGGEEKYLAKFDVFYPTSSGKKIPDSRRSELYGYVDMHTHPMSHLGFGKKLMHGAPDIGSIVPAGTSYRGFDVFKRECNTTDEIATSIEHALGKCSATHQEWAPDNDCGDVQRRMVIGILEGTKNAQSVHGTAFGAPTFQHWPRFNDITHQQMWVDWIRRNHEYGLRVMVALAVNNKTLADAVKGDGPTDDKSSADLQVDEIIKFVGRHQDFMEVAYTSAQLRRIVAANKLAVIVGMEVDNIGNFIQVPNLTNTTIKSELQRLHDKGVRYIFPIHVLDNKFGGTAIYENTFNYSNKRETGSFWRIRCAAPEDHINHIFKNDDGAQWGGLLLGQDPFRNPDSPPPCAFGIGHRNMNGLTPQGDFAIREMMKLGMMIDVDHMSQSSVEGVLDIAKLLDYPLNSGHNGLRDPRGGNENSRTIQQLNRIRDLGGMVGVGWGDSDASTFLNNYRGVLSAMGNRNTAIGTDINGLVTGPKPRLDANGRPLSNVRYDPSFPKCRTGIREWDYNTEGVAHYGLMPDFIRDIKNLTGGSESMERFFKSAEYFAQMWEKSEQRAFTITGGAPTVRIFNPNAVETLCPQELVAGDRDFGGHGPRINCDVNLQLAPDGSGVNAVINFSARETASDWSETRGTWTILVIAAPRGMRITRINSALRTSVTFVSPGAGSEFGACNDGDIITPSIARGPVRQFKIIGDTGSSDISADGDCHCDTQIRRIEFNPINVTLAPIR